VLEPLAGYLALTERLWDDRDLAGAWNFGPAEEDCRPVRWVCERLASLWGEGLHWQTDAGSHPPETSLLKLDCSRARALLGFRPRLPLERALEWVVEWYRGYDRGDSARKLCESQIERYQAAGSRP
jgi:CDP-glucose 4,6-dehydratase